MQHLKSDPHGQVVPGKVNQIGQFVLIPIHPALVLRPATGKRVFDNDRCRIAGGVGLATIFSPFKAEVMDGSLGQGPDFAEIDLVVLCPRARRFRCYCLWWRIGDRYSSYEYRRAAARS